MNMDAAKSLKQHSSSSTEMIKVAEQNAERFKTLFAKLNSKNLSPDWLAEVYTENMHFEDSFHVIDGLDEFYRYCDSLYENIESISFRFHEQWLQPGAAMLTWTMQYQHPRLNKGKPIYVDGASHIRFNEKIYFHKDYFDGGQLLYEQVPLLGSAIRFLKDRLA